MKIVRILCFCILWFLPLSKINAGGFKGGLIAGFCASQMDGDGLGGYNKFGPTSGFFVNRMYDDKWGGQLEIRYNQKGAAYVGGEQSYKCRLNYLEVPLMVTYKLKKRIRLEGGLIPAVMFRSRVLFNQFETSPQFSKYDFPIALGGYYILGDKMEVGIRGTYSTLPVHGKVTDLKEWVYPLNNILVFNNAFNFVILFYLR